MKLEEVAKTSEKIINQFPVPNAPASFGKPYTFPDDIVHLTSQELGKWMFRLAGWKGYAIRLLAAEEYQYIMMTKCFEAKMEMKMSAIKSDKKLVKEALRGQVLTDDESIKKLKIDCIEKEAYLSVLKKLVDLYSMQLEVVSRDISRRALDIKMFQKGITTLDD